MQSRKGQGFLAVVLLVGGVVVAIGAFLAFLAFSSTDSSYGLQSSQGAEAAASSGAEDALLQLARNGSFSNTSGYSVQVGANTAIVTVNQNTPSTGFVTVLSTATVSQRTKKITVVLSENPQTNQVTVVSWQESK